MRGDKVSNTLLKALIKKKNSYLLKENNFKSHKIKQCHFLTLNNGNVQFGSVIV